MNFNMKVIRIYIVMFRIYPINKHIQEYSCFYLWPSDCETDSGRKPKVGLPPLALILRPNTLRILTHTFCVCVCVEKFLGAGQSANAI